MSHPPLPVISGFENRKSNGTACEAAFKPNGPFGPTGTFAQKEMSTLVFKAESAPSSESRTTSRTQ